MSSENSTALGARLERLESHLRRENPTLLGVVKSFRSLDRVAYALGLLPRTESFATRVPWWPLVSVLGTFSSGKSTFINSYLGQKIQQSGNQAVDDKFTVVCYGPDGEPRVLPGLALDADPRFPFYQISYDIDEVAAGEGRRVDAYLQLKTCNSERLRGRILIDSPGFDADEQRTSTLRLTDHIIGLSDLVLVFFDARHPEPGAMQDTLKHLVSDTISRADSNKFLYILNQIDNTAREDNPEEVFAAWQRALAQKGLTAGRFFRIYDQEASIPITDEHLRARFESKRDEDLAEICGRMERVEIERAYRIVGVLEKLARTISGEYAPAIERAKRDWKQGVLWADAAAFGLAAMVALGLTIYGGYWDGLAFSAPGGDTFAAHPSLAWGLGIGLLALAAWGHFAIRRGVARVVIRRLERRDRGAHATDGDTEPVVSAFRFNTRWWSPVWWTAPLGWGGINQRRVEKALTAANEYVEALNDRFTDPSGRVEVESPASEPRRPETA